MFAANHVVRRIVVSLLIGILIGVAIGEIPFIFQREIARSPETIVLTIPAGTADQVAMGEDPPSIPDSMVFVVGDTLVVKNEDAVGHKLGPLWIPSNSTARFPLLQEEHLTFECTFQPEKYFGLDVHEPLTWNTRLFGILYAGIPLGVLIALYSFAFPPKKKENAPA